MSLSGLSADSCARNSMFRSWFVVGIRRREVRGTLALHCFMGSVFARASGVGLWKSRGTDLGQNVLSTPTPYGAFVEIEEGVEGLIHVSELSWTKRITRPSDVLNIGQEVEAVVLGVNKEEQKISLGVRQLEPNPWDEIEHRYPIGKQVRGTVRNMTAYGAFLELEEGIDGMIHVSDMSWTRKINHPSEMLKKGDEIEAVVIDIDKNAQRISLGLKQMEEDPWRAIENKYKIGDL